MDKNAVTDKSKGHVSDRVYQKLQEHLDSFPVGFSKTESGIEITILKKIFEPGEPKWL
jgi:hypothetical protein